MIMAEENGATVRLRTSARSRSDDHKTNLALVGRSDEETTIRSSVCVLEEFALACGR